MPEYLAPGVYVEEVDTGSKPIEGVSTSTAGMIGVTERGPVNVPMLVTSAGEYRRVFGDLLNPALYGEHRFLPHAVEGFFTNSGKRVYVTRVLEPGAAIAASRNLVAPDAAPPTTQLARGAAAGATTVIALDNPGFAIGNTVQIGDGAGVEFRRINAAPAAANAVAVNHPLSTGHANPQVVQVITLTAVGGPTTLAADVAAGSNVILVASEAGMAQHHVLTLGAGAELEHASIDVVGAAAPGGTPITLRRPLLLAHTAGAGTPIQTNTAAAAAAGVNLRPVDAARPSQAGDTLLLTATAAGAFAAGDLAGVSTPGGGGDFDPTQPDVEVRVVSALTRVTLEQAASADYPRGSRVERITLNRTGPWNLTESAPAGATVVSVSNRTNFALTPAVPINDILEVGLALEREFAEVAALPATLPAPNPGRVVLRSPLRLAHATATPAPPIVWRRRVTGVTHATVLAADTARGAPTLVLAGAAGLAVGDFIRVTTPAGARFYHALAAAPPPAGLTPQVLTLDAGLATAQSASALVVTRVPMMEVRALDAGQWGNRLRVGMELQDALLTTSVRGNPPSTTTLLLASAAGVEVGTELEIVDGANPANTVRVKVNHIDRQNDSLVTLEATTVLPVWVTGAPPASRVRSIEYRFVVDLLRQPDPANPLRDSVAIDREVFANLSLDARHSRYFQRVIGCTWDLTNPAVTVDDTPPAGRPLRRADRRSEGESNYIRVRDLAPTNGWRPGPVASYEQRADGTRRLILLPLVRGDDQLGAFLAADRTYIGNDNTDPELRTGLFTLRNIEEVSIVAAPGRTSTSMQGALINHCELMRYRFAVLDGSPPPADAMADVQAQRQQFDTKYAALYHPWLLIPDPYPLTAGTVPEYPIPPSGHMLGIYARTDVERGVHKAPANEVVRGVVGLQRLLNKEQHDILNPYPVNINVIRDFRPNNRGIRIYGGRVITSDSDWKYVNVRRLIIFIEASIDRGLQWVVFEPNADPLWARVRRAISNFLTLLWRNGALEGTRPEEAYFVKCDRTTMTQTDIDQGRLICLVGVAPVKPAEFVIVRIGLWTAHAEE